jgi:hypothetical protein
MSSALVAQGIEHGSPKAGVAGSNPAGGTEPVRRSEALFETSRQRCAFCEHFCCDWLSRWLSPGQIADCRCRRVTCGHSLTLAGSVGGMDKPDDYEERIKRIVDQAPPLTQAQRDKIATSLRLGSADTDTDR